MRASRSKTFAIVAVAIIAFAAFYIYSPQSFSGANTGRSLGVWTQVVDWPQGFSQTGSNYAKAIFQGPAGFTNIEAVVNENFNSEIAVLGQAATWADANGGQIEVICVLDPTAIQSNTPFAISDWENMVNTLKGHSSIISFGINGERSPTVTSSDYATLGAYVASAGKQFINYYTPAGISRPSNFAEIRHTNYPDYGDPIIQLAGPPYVGESFGYFAPYTEVDWNQNVVNSIMQTMGNTPVQYSQFTNFAYGDPEQAGFQNWVASSPYRNLFNGAGTPVTTLTTPTTSTSTTTITSTSATTITSTSVSGTSTTTITSTSTSTFTSTSTTTLVSTGGQPPPAPMNPTILIAAVVVVGVGAYLLLRRRR